MSAKEIEIYNNIKQFIKGTGYKIQSIYGTYYFDLFKKEKQFEYCITFFHEERTFTKKSRETNIDFAIWNNEHITMEELKIINYIVKELNWEVE